MKQLAALAISLAFVLSVVFVYPAWTVAQAATPTVSTDTEIHLPLIVGGEGSKSGTTSESSITQKWLSYYHDKWGLSFEYPDDWQVDVPDFETIAKGAEDLPEGYSNNPDMSTLYTVGHQVKLYPSGGYDGYKAIYVVLHDYTLSPGATLEEWVKVQEEVNFNFGIGGSGVEFSPPELTSFPRDYRPNVDEILLEPSQGKNGQNSIIWIARDKLVYEVDLNAVDVEIANRFIASLEFDSAKQQELQETAPFAGDETGLKKLLEMVSQESAPIQDENQPPNTASIAAATRPPKIPRALPALWWSPLILSGSASYNVDCTSGEHNDGANFAVDAGVNQAPVYSMADNSTVVYSQWNNQGYGNLIILSTPVFVKGVSRIYYHYYGHLYFRFSSVGNTANRGVSIGISGNTGSLDPEPYGYHLHFHIQDNPGQSASNTFPVDATPVLGFRPNLNYPNTTTACGQMVAKENDEVVLESAAYLSYQPANPPSNYFWNCINEYNSMAECYMKADPDYDGNPTFGFDDPALAPKLMYDAYLPRPNPTTWYIWTCGDSGGDNRDDTIHFRVGSTNRIPIIGVSWVWVSVDHPSLTVPTFTAGQATYSFRIAMREDGTRWGRILFSTRSPNDYDPNNDIFCGHYP